MNINIAHTLSQNSALLTNTAAIIEVAGGRTVSFEQLQEKTDAYAHILSRGGVKAKEKVMLMVKPSADFICLTFALFKIGAPVILIDPGMGYKNLLRCIEGVQPVSFIGIPKAYLFKTLFRKPFASIKHSFCCGNSLGLFGGNIEKECNFTFPEYPAYHPQKDDLAAIIFTTGSTGPPKGVRYDHSIFHAQLRLIRDYYGIGTGQIDQPAFPLFALFSIALGATAVIPDMDTTRPAKIDPETYISSIQKYGVSYSFASPALWKVLAGYCSPRDARLGSLHKILMAGAPVSGELIAAMQSILPENAKIHTPYGATESLPLVSIEGTEIINETWELTRTGKGVCVGRPLPGIEVSVLPVRESPIAQFDAALRVEPFAIGEIIVKGDVVTKSYENNPEENRLAKIQDGDTFWHRMGDVGYLDDSGRLWFCGRKAHRVKDSAARKTYYPIPCEAILNEHKQIARSALVGVYSTRKMSTVPVMIIEPVQNCSLTHSLLIQQAKVLGGASELTADIKLYLVHLDFPVDIRHNAKIFREKLAVWAKAELEGLL